MAKPRQPIEKEPSEFFPYVSKEAGKIPRVSKARREKTAASGRLEVTVTPVGTTLPSHVVAAVLEARARRLPLEQIQKQVKSRGMPPLSIDTIKNICTFPQMYREYSGYRERSKPRHRDFRKKTRPI